MLDRVLRKPLHYVPVSHFLNHENDEGISAMFPNKSFLQIISNEILVSSTRMFFIKITN